MRLSFVFAWCVFAASTLVCRLDMAHAAEYHVSPAGTDIAGGALVAPWRSMEFAVGKLKSGDTLVVHAGTYQVKEQMNITASRVTIRGAAGPRPKIFGDALAAKSTKPEERAWDGAKGVKVRKHHIFTVTGANVLLEHLEIGHSPWCAVIFGGRNNTVRDCYLHHTDFCAFRAHSGASGWAFLDNVVTHTKTTTMSCFGQNGRVAGNLIYDGAGGFTFKGGARDILVENNVISTYRSKGIGLGGGSGIQFKRPHPYVWEGRWIVARNNLVVVGGAAVALRFDESKQCRAYHNTIVQLPGARAPAINVTGNRRAWDGVICPSRHYLPKGSSWFGVPLRKGRWFGDELNRHDCVDNRIYNNIIISLAEDARAPLIRVQPFSETKMVLSHNLLYRAHPGELFNVKGRVYRDLGRFQAETGLGQYCRMAPPPFGEAWKKTLALKPGGRPDPAWFALAKNSPAIDAGVTGLNDRYPRKSAAQGPGPDLGAFESAFTHSARAPKTVKAAPAPPTIKADILLVKGNPYHHLTRDALTALGVKYELAPALELREKDFSRYRAIIWGYDASRCDQEYLKPKFDAYLKQGGKVLAMSWWHAQAEPWLPAPAQKGIDGSLFKMDKILKPDHPLVNRPHKLGLKDILSIRGGEAYAPYCRASSEWTLILGGAQGRATSGYRPLEHPGAMHYGLMEYRKGDGVVVICCLRPEPAWREAAFDPKADNAGRKLLVNMLHYVGVKTTPD